MSGRWHKDEDMTFKLWLGVLMLKVAGIGFLCGIAIGFLAGWSMSW